MKPLNRIALLPFVLASFLIAPQISAQSVQEEARETPVQRILRASREEAPDAARLKTVDEWLAKVSRNTGETPDAIAYALARNVRYLFDAEKIRVAPVELLEALNAYSGTTESLYDTLHRYDAARIAAPDKSHGAAMRAMSAGGAERR